MVKKTPEFPFYWEETDNKKNKEVRSFGMVINTMREIKQCDVIGGGAA